MASDNKKSFWLSFLVIAGINLIVLWPSLYHVARSDQVIFLIETEQWPDFVSLWNHVVSYDRTRLLNPGDTILYRPLLFSFMAVERWLFGYNFLFWQAAGIVLHLIVLGMLLRLLRKIKSSGWADLAVLSFSVLYLTQEMVIWQHIHGYLLTLIFMLAAISRFLGYLSSDLQDRRHFRWMMIFGFLGCLTYEFGVLVCLAMAVFLYIHEVRAKRKREGPLPKSPGYPAWWMLLPPAVYIVLNAGDYLARGIRDLPLLYGGMNFSAGAELVKMLGFLAGGLMFPQFLRMIPGQRTYLQEVAVSDIFLHWGAYSPGEVFNLVFLALAAVCVCYGSVRVWQGRKGVVRFETPEELSMVNRVWVMALFFFAFLAYILMLAGARSTYRGIAYLNSSLYHYYFLAVLLLPAVYGTVFLLYRRVRQGHGLLKGLAAAAVIFSVLVNAQQSHALNLRLAGRSASWRNFIQSVHSFRKAHAGEPDFSFDVMWSQSSRPVEFFVRTPYGEQDIRGRDYDYFFARHIKKDNPAYYLVYSHRFGLVVFQSRGQALRHLAGIGVKLQDLTFNGT